MARNNNRSVVTIDFGTTQSCFAFVLGQNPNDIYVHKWGEGSSLLKTPTSVLLVKEENGELKFCDFGSDAESKYWEADDKSNYELFRRFKMTLHSEKNISDDMLVTSEKGRPEKALTIISYALKYIKDTAMQQHIPRGTTTTWVLTVPAIWSERSQIFMKKAAVQAGLVDDMHSKNLLIGIEPEAAAFLCTKGISMSMLGVNSSLQPTSQKVLSLYEGHSGRDEDGDHFMVLDGGGGSMDIIAFKFNSSGKLDGLVEPTGGPWGGCSVDDEFITWLKTQWGEEYVTDLKSKCPSAWNEIISSFMRMKSSYSEGLMALKITLTTNEEIEEVFGKGLGKHLQRGKIVLDSDTVNSLFKPTLNKITTHLDELLSRPSMNKVKYAFLVGGFGSSTLVRNHLKEYLNKINKKRSQAIEIAVPPNECWTAVVKGAAMFGLNNKKIATRIAARSVGQKLRVPYTEGKGYNDKHVYENKYKRRMVSNVFSPFVSKGERYETGMQKEFVTIPLNSSDREMFVEIFQSTASYPVHIDERTVSRTCSVHVPLPSTENRELKTIVTFGASLSLQFRTGKDEICTTVKYCSEK